MNQKPRTFNPYGRFVGSFIPNCIMKDRSIGASEKLILARLFQFAGQDGECYPSQQTISDETGLGVSTVKDSLKKLEDKGFILKISPEGKDRLMHMHNKYVFLEHDCYQDQPTRTSENHTIRAAEIRLSGSPKSDPPNKENHNKENHDKEKAAIKQPDYLNNTIPPLSARRPAKTLEEIFDKMEPGLKRLYPHADFEKEKQTFILINEGTNLGADPSLRIKRWFDKAPVKEQPQALQPVMDDERAAKLKKLREEWEA